MSIVNVAAIFAVVAVLLPNALLQAAWQSVDEFMAQHWLGVSMIFAILSPAFLLNAVRLRRKRLSATDAN